MLRHSGQGLSISALLVFCVIVVVGAVLYVVKCLAGPLATTHEMPVAPPSSCCEDREISSSARLPNVPGGEGAKTTLRENR